MSSQVDVRTHKGYTINIHYDEMPINPVEDYDMLGTMVCWHRSYNLGHKQPKTDPEEFLQDLVIEADPSIESRIDYWEDGNGYSYLCNEYNAMSEIVREVAGRIQLIVRKELDKHYIILPLYLYDHSGLALNTGGFNCPWDSGQIGYIYVSKEAIRKEYNWKLITKKRLEKIESILKNEVKTYHYYLSGAVYGYMIKAPDNNEDVDSCWGFLGDYDESGLMEYATNAIDCHIKMVEEYKTIMYRLEIGEIQF